MAAQAVSAPFASSPAALVVSAGQAVQTWDETYSLAKHVTATQAVWAPHECNTMLVGATERSLTSGGGATLMTQGFKQEKIGQCNPMLVGATAGAGAGGDNGA